MLFYVAPSGLIQTVRTPLKPNTIVQSSNRSIVQSFNLSIIQLFRAKDAFGGHINRVHALPYGYVALAGIKCIFFGQNDGKNAVLGAVFNVNLPNLPYKIPYDYGWKFLQCIDY